MVCIIELPILFLLLCPSSWNDDSIHEARGLRHLHANPAEEGSGAYHSILGNPVFPVAPIHRVRSLLSSVHRILRNNIP